MWPIYNGESVVLHSPTGTGKSVCFLLPILQRMDEQARFHGAGLQLLILTPTSDLQMQLTMLVRELVGRDRAESVSQLRRDQDNSMVNARIVVATPRQVMELLDNSATSEAWMKAIYSMDTVVVDEADRLVDKWNAHQRKKRGKEGVVDPCVKLLEIIGRAKARLPDDPFQVVAASATMNRRTERTVRFCTQVEMRFIRAGGTPMPGHMLADNEDGTNVSAAAVPSEIKHTVRVVKLFRPAQVMDTVANTICDLRSQRTLVVIAASGKVSNAMFGLSPVVAQLRFRLEGYGYAVETSSMAVQKAANAWDDRQSGRPGPAADRNQKEVVVGTREAMRGIHLDDISAVVIIGDPVTASEYMHCVGRTCRHKPGRPPQGGAAVTVCPESVSTRLFNWAKLTGFTLLDVPLDKAHPECPTPMPQEVQDLDQGPFDVMPLDDAEMGEGEEEDLFAEPGIDDDDPDSIAIAGAWG